MIESAPPGRAGRLWLRSRIASARRNLELLDRKRRLLNRELADLGPQREFARRDWVQTCLEAQVWGLRATALGGVSDISFVAQNAGGRAEVEVPWHNTMGVTHPGLPNLTLPSLAPAVTAAASAALGPATAAYRRALEAGVAYAALDRSFLVLEAELRSTERRRRAIERRRIPTLQEALHRLELRLDELEREERVIGRWAKQRTA